MMILFFLIILRIVRLITDRKPFKLVVDSRDICRKMPGEEEEHPSIGKGFFRALRNDIKNNLDNMLINQAEIMFDEFRNVPYKLRPYTRLGESSDGPDAIFIYNRKIDSKMLCYSLPLPSHENYLQMESCCIL
jgi:hypothetical protein